MKPLKGMKFSLGKPKPLFKLMTSAIICSQKGIIQAVHHMFGILRHLAQGFRAVQMLAANNEPYLIVIKNRHFRILNG